jgi:hypothetical protein
MPQGRPPHAWTREERLEVHRARANGRGTKSPAGEATLQRLIHAYHATSDELDQSRALLLIAAER